MQDIEAHLRGGIPDRDIDDLDVTVRLPAVPPSQQAMLTEVRELILTARQQVAQAVNARLTILHWQIGDRVHREVFQGEAG